MLVATVGTNDGTNITLTMNGARVTHLTAGTYEIQVHDNSTFHNFHLTGPGVDQSTEIDDEERRKPGRSRSPTGSTSSSATRTRAS